jgi:uncharacterized membrane protein required for colicin V production
MEGSSLAIWDLVVLAVIGFCTVRGAMKGMVWQLATIAAIVLCFFFAETGSLMLAPMIGLKEPLNRWVAMFVLYVLCAFVSFALARSMKTAIDEAKFSEYDKHMGAVLGLVKGFAIALVLTFFVVTLSETAREHVLHTRAGKYSAIAMDRLHPVMPKELHDVLEPYIHQLDRDGLDLKYADRHEHDHSEDAHDPKSPGQGGSEPDSQVSAERRKLELLLAQLPGMDDAELRKLAIDALLNTQPEHRSQLLDLLSSGIPALTKIIVIEWQQGKPDAARNDEELRDRLLKEISGIYFNSSGAQQSFIEEIEADLMGLPLEIETAVLMDWHADLLGLDPDPDPTTDFLSRTDRRILNQLLYAGISLESLNSALRERLDAVR